MSLKCVMCNKVTSTGVYLYGINNKYRVCNKCLAKYSRGKPMQNKRSNTIHNKLVLQEKINAKLQYYLIEQIIEEKN